MHGAAAGGTAEGLAWPSLCCIALLGVFLLPNPPKHFWALQSHQCHAHTENLAAGPEGTFSSVTATLLQSCTEAAAPDTFTCQKEGRTSRTCGSCQDLGKGKLQLEPHSAPLAVEQASIQVNEAAGGLGCCGLDVSSQEGEISVIRPEAARRYCRYHEALGAQELGPGSSHRRCQACSSSSPLLPVHPNF